MTTHIPAVMDNPAVLSCLVKHAIRLGRSVRHPDFGLAVTYSGNKGKPGAITQQHILTIALHPEPQADMLDIHVTKTASRYEGKLEELSAALQAALKQSNGQGASPNDRTVTLVVKADETPTRSLGELFSDACHGPLLQEVVAYLPEKEILRLTRTCKDVGLVVSGSSLLQLRLRKLYHGLGQGSPVLDSNAASSADRLDWLLERELRINTLRPRYYFGERAPIKGVLLQSDGGFELSRLTYLIPMMDMMDVNFTLYELRDTSRAERISAPQPLRTSPMVSPSTAAISTEDELLVTVHRDDFEELGEPQRNFDTWRFRFLRLEHGSASTSVRRPQEDDGESHPDARLPFIDLAVNDRPSTQEGRQPSLHLSIAQDGLILFRLDMGKPEGPLAVVLDWKRGEARGVVMDTSGYALRLMSHTLAGGRYLISTGLSNLEGPDKRMSPGLWIANIPRNGRRPGRLPTLQLPATGAEAADRLYTIACDDLTRIVPEAEFLLPFASGADRGSPNNVSPIYHLFNGLLSVGSVSGDIQAHDALALFTFSGYVTQGIDATSARPVQCSGVAPVSHLIAIWQTMKDTKAAKRPEEDGIPRGEECGRTQKDFCRIAWEDWQTGIHVFALNTLLPPVLHGTTLIVGYSQADEEAGDHGPTKQPELGDDSLAIPLKDLKLAIRDFNINRLSGTTQPQPWHKLGLPIAHLLQPDAEQISLPDCDDAMISHSDWTITSAPMQSTRGMFESQTMQGDLKYSERIASLPAGVLARFSEQCKPCACKKHGLDPYADRVSRLVYDGHSLVVETYRSDVRLAFAPLYDATDGHSSPTKGDSIVTGKTA